MPKIWALGKNCQINNKSEKEKEANPKNVWRKKSEEVKHFPIPNVKENPDRHTFPQDLKEIHKCLNKDACPESDGTCSQVPKDSKCSFSPPEERKEGNPSMEGA